MDARVPHSRRHCCLAALFAVGAAAHAQVASNISADGTLGTSVNHTGNVFEIGGGTSVGGVNLFHSFGQFSVGTGDVANFSGAASIQHIISRVTGGAASAIDGTVATSIAGASVWLVNPNGIMFGPNAVIDVGGGFHASTADFLRLRDGAVFFADPASASTLSSAPVASFGFLDDSPAPVSVETPTVQDPASPRAGTPGIQPGAGGTLSIVGGDITLGAADGSAPAYLLAGGGNIRIVGVASPGEAVLGPNAGVDVSGFSRLGNVTLRGNSLVDAHETVIRGGNVLIEDATVLPGAFSLFGMAPPPDGGFVDIAAFDGLEIRGTGPDPVFGAPPGVLVFAGLDPVLPVAKVPDVKLAGLTVGLSGTSGVTVNRFGDGEAGVVAIEADTFTVGAGASVSLINAFSGSGGLLRVDAREVVLDGGGDPALVTGLLATSVFNPAYLTTSIDPALTFADSGSISLEVAGRLSVRGGAEIISASRSFGGSGSIDIRAGDVEIAGKGSTIVSESNFSGDSGAVRIAASGQVSISGGALVRANTYGGGAGGEVRIEAGGALVISDEASGIATQAVPLPAEELTAFAELLLGSGASFEDLVAAFGLPAGSDLMAVLRAMNDFGLSAIPAERLDAGDGGDIVIESQALRVSGLNAGIDASTAGDGNAGSIDVRAASIDITDGAIVGSRSGIPDLATGRLFVGSGDAGSVNLSADGVMRVSGAGATVSTDTRGTGDAGNVVLRAMQLQVQPGGKISSSSRGSGLAGNIDIVLGDSLLLYGGSIETEAVTSDGGNISIVAPRLVDMLDGRITTSVQSGFGNGGNIFVDPNFIVLQGSRIEANAFGGDGGNIDLIADFLILSPDSIIRASSALGVDGIIRTTAPDNDISASLAVLPVTYVDASSQLPANCGAARAGQSSLTSIGRGGLPPAPDTYLLSPGVDAAPPGAALLPGVTDDFLYALGSGGGQDCAL